jgi:site-specific recombinase XerD
MHLRREHVLSDRIRVLSEEGARTKSGRWREITLTPSAKAALQELSQTGYVLPRMTPQSLSRHFAHDAKKAGLPGNLHCLRHTFCSHLVMLGIPLKTVQELAGHATPAQTNKYAHLSPDHLKGALAGLDL